MTGSVRLTDQLQRAFDRDARLRPFAAGNAISITAVESPC
jgi:hypothetical protein